ncbi:MAG: hypothetical protein H7Z72_21815 [Bacteroidetes bacterium]|nr:hypothetical protein [Fibrella sp.]
MRNKIVDYLKEVLGIKPRKARKVTFLIIGTVNCGKTALIYFIYDYLIREMMDLFHPLQVEEGSKNISLNNLIKQVELRDFVSMIQSETQNQGDFIGTETGSISSIVHRMNGLIIQIYNISGEIFKDVDSNKELVDSLCNDLQESNIEDTYCLLCKSFNEGDIEQVGVDFITLHASLKRGSNAKNIFENIKQGKNTLRIVTKFDNFSESNIIINDTELKNSHPFHRMAKMLCVLNELHEVKEQHNREFIVSTLSNPFPVSIGYENIVLNKFFICTGFYSKINPDEKIFEIGVFNGKERNVLRKQYKGKNLSNLGMYGIDEIINFSIKNRSYFKKLQPKIGLNAISLSHYKFILGLKK